MREELATYVEQIGRELFLDREEGGGPGGVRKATVAVARLDDRSTRRTARSTTQDHCAAVGGPYFRGRDK
jgi:hypothetical protein